MVSNMLQLLVEFLHNPGDLLQDERRQRTVIASLASVFFVCVLFSMVRGVARQRNVSRDSDTRPIPVIPAPTQTKWWVRREPSQTPNSLMPPKPTSTGGIETSAGSIKCPAYALDFKPGTFGYISLFPPYKNLLRSEAGRNYSTVGFIETGGWVRILAGPICDDDGYVWLKVQSAAGANNWTAGGHKIVQWVIPCPDPNKKCSKKKPNGSISTTAADNNDGGDSNNPKSCASDKLVVGLDAQVTPNDLLVVRSEPFTGKVLGHISPLAVINVIDGPKCAGGAVWWKVWGSQTGWAVENNLRACPKEGNCDPWKNEQLLH
jgi:hypothetical protein